MDELSARNLARYGLRRGAYDGANSRRFVLFESLGDGNELRREYLTKRERDAFALRRLREMKCAARDRESGLTISFKE